MYINCKKIKRKQGLDCEVFEQLNKLTNYYDFSYMQRAYYVLLVYRAYYVSM